VGLIGAGYIGAVHAASLQALPEARLAAVADLSEERARAVAAEHGATVYTDYGEMLAREDLAAVVVATPDNAHVAPALAAARAGAHLLVEKPLATTLEDCQAIAGAEQEHRVRVLVGHTLRWDPRYALAQQAVAAGQLGEISYLYARRNNMTGVARRAGPVTSVARFLAVHDIDWAQWVLGERASRVVARSVQRVLTGLNTPDAYFLLVRFPSGALACIEATWILPESGSLQWDPMAEVVGSAGALYISVHDQGLRLDTERGLRFLDVTYRPVLRGRSQGVYVEEMRHFLEVVRGAAPACTVAEARAAVAVVLAAEQSADTGEEIAVG
jgi:predicted dehydrogenase